jgi:trigger factor
MDDEALSKALKDESFDATVKRIRADLEKNAVEQNKIAKQNAVVEALLSKSDFEVPMSQVLSESEKGVREYIQRARYMGMQDSDFEARREEIMSSIMDHSKKQVRLTYILDAIAKEEKIVATDEDIIARLGDVAASQPKPTTAEEIFENIKANGNLDGARAQVVGEKVIEFIIENAK